MAHAWCQWFACAWRRVARTNGWSTVAARLWHGWSAVGARFEHGSSAVGARLERGWSAVGP
eukprot:5627472-Lingulodinium_polyedra.AAC.1